MDIDKTAAKRSKSHVRYYKKDGSLVPGVTTVLNVISKGGLVPWANSLGLAGIDVKNYVDSLALAGTIAHSMILAHCKNVKFEAGSHPADLIDLAENSFLKYLTWAKQHTIEPIMCEAALVSEQHGYGGTIDFLGKVDGVPTLIDYKTSKSLYQEHLIQVSAYHSLLIENGHEVAGIRVLKIGRNESEGFSERSLAPEETNVCFSLFTHALQIYRLQKAIHV